MEYDHGRLCSADVSSSAKCRRRSGVRLETKSASASSFNSTSETTSPVQPAVQRLGWLDVTSLFTMVATDDSLVCNQEVGGSIPVVST